MWKIFASLCIRRPVVLTPELTPCQSRIQDLFVELETQNSHMSAHEMRHKADLERMAEMAKHQQEGKSTEKMDDAVSLLTAKDLELAWEASEKEFWKLSEKSCKCYTCFDLLHLSMIYFNPMCFPAHSKPASSTKATAWRELNRNLVLLVQQKLGTSSDWGLPAVEVTGTQTLRSVSYILWPVARVIIINYSVAISTKLFIIGVV